MVLHDGSLQLTTSPRTVAAAEETLAWGATGSPGLDLLTVAALAAAAIGTRIADYDCGIWVVSSGGVPDTVASSSDVPIRFDWLRHKLGQGPGLEPSGHGSVLSSSDLATDARWPDFGPLCESVVGVRSLVLVEIPVVGPARAAMSFYSARPGAFDPERVDRSARLARLASISVQRLLLSRESTERQEMSESNRVASALGIVMGRYRLTPSRAFEMLRDAAATLHVGLMELALDVIRTRRMPARQINDARH